MTAHLPDLPASLTSATGNGGLACLRVATDRCQGEIYLQGAHVTAWTPAGADPVLFVSAEAPWAAGEPIPGGIPLCGPWFAKGRKNDKEPQHGFFRRVDWTLTDAADDDGTVSLTFRLDSSAYPAYDGAPFTATYDVTMGDTLTMSLRVDAGDADVDLEEALHAYFRVGDIRQVSVGGLDGCRYADRAPGGRAVNAQSGDVSFTRETDRVYAHEGGVTLVDPVLARTITIGKEGSASTVLWNPWAAKAAASSSIGDEEWTGMLCIEPANAVRGAITVPAGGTHTLTATVSVAGA